MGTLDSSHLAPIFTTSLLTLCDIELSPRAARDRWLRTSRNNWSSEVSKVIPVLSEQERNNGFAIDPTPLWWTGNEKAVALTKKATLITETTDRENILSNPQTEGLWLWQYDMTITQRMAIRQSQKSWKDSIANTPAWPRNKAVLNFLLLTGHNCLAKYLYHIGLFSHLYCTLCDQQEKTDRHHLLRFTALSSTAASHSYWETTGECVNDADNVPAICINK